MLQQDLKDQVDQKALLPHLPLGPDCLLDLAARVDPGGQLHQPVFFLAAQPHQGFQQYQASHSRVGQEHPLADQVGPGHQQGDHLATCHLRELFQERQVF